eukprot:gene3363-1713_t
MLLKRSIIEKTAAESLDSELWLMFIGYAKTFDTVKDCRLESMVKARCTETSEANFQEQNSRLMINEAKTNVLTLNGSGHGKLGDVEMETVEQFKYLGSILDIDSPTSHEIK